jgi:hypothetical protein
MDESTCLQNRNNQSMKNTCYRCDTLHQEASKQLFDLIQNKINKCSKITLNDDYSICLCFHKYLNINIYFYGFKDEAYVEIDCGKYGSTHFHPDGSEVLDYIFSFIDGEHIIVSKLWSYISYIIKKEDLKNHPLIILFGVGVNIITKDGCYKKKQFLNELSAQG